MKQLGGLLLPDSIQWIDKSAWSPVAMEAGRTLGGTLLTWSQPLIGGRAITLEAEEGVTWLNRATVEALTAMADQADASFPLIWESETFTVMFRHHDAPATAFTPIWPDHDYHTGSIKLMEV